MPINYPSIYCGYLQLSLFTYKSYCDVMSSCLPTFAGGRDGQLVRDEKVEVLNGKSLSSNLSG